MDIPKEYQINDKRSIDFFKKISFSNYEKKEILIELKKNIIDYRLEAAIYWSTELLISGYINELLDLLIKIICLNINKSSPKLPILLNERLTKIDNILASYNLKKDLEYRNNQQLRNTVCELVSILTISNKNKTITFSKIKEVYFDINVLKNRLQAKNLELLNNVMKEDDPSELQLSLNEMAYCLNNNSSCDLIFFWLSWILTWEKKQIKKNGSFICANRHVLKSNEYNTDVIWLIWDIIVNETNKRVNLNLRISINSLFELFKKNYKPSNKSKKIDYLLYSIILLVDTKDYNIPINHLDPLIIQVCSNINIMYKNAKKNEICMRENMLDQRIIRNDYHITKKKEKENKIIEKENKIIEKEKNLIEMKVGKEIKNEKVQTNISQKKMDIVFDIDNEINSSIIPPQNYISKNISKNKDITETNVPIAEKMIKRIDNIIFNRK